MLIISTIWAAPGVTPSTAKACEECKLNYDPICAGPQGTKNDREKKSFGNLCVMKKYNCEKGESLLNIFFLFPYTINLIHLLKNDYNHNICASFQIW